MKELTEHDKQLLIDSIPGSNPVLFCPGLQGHGATLLDRSQYANHGTITGATWKRLPSGIYVNRFDGIDAQLDHGNASSLDVANITFSMWMRSAVDWAAHPGWGFYASKYEEDVGGWVFRHWSNAPNVYILLSKAGSHNFALQTTPLQVNRFYKVTGTYDGLSIRIFLNGLLDADPTPWVGSMGTTNTGFVQNPHLTMPMDTGFVTILPYARTAAEEYRAFNRERHLFGV